jgi:hypothetical protein
MEIAGAADSRSAAYLSASDPIQRPHFWIHCRIEAIKKHFELLEASPSLQEAI